MGIHGTCSDLRRLKEKGEGKSGVVAIGDRGEAELLSPYFALVPTMWVAVSLEDGTRHGEGTWSPDWQEGASLLQTSSQFQAWVNYNSQR